MGKVTGFLEYERKLPARRPVAVRVRDWREVYEPFPEDEARRQAARCMDCGIPFCHEGCPLGNLIPEWNDLVYRGNWSEAAERLHATNNFPEFTGRLCPAPCEAACVLGINQPPVSIERTEYEIAERAFAEGWVRPVRASAPTGKAVAVVGSGPAGLACAQQLARAGHAVTVFERAERPGGLLRYGIPEFKMEKAVLERRLAQLRAEGVVFRCGVQVGTGPADGSGVAPVEPGLARGVGAAAAPGVEVVPAAALLEEFDALVLAGGSTVPRDLAVPGRELAGIHFAMEYLKPANLVREGALAESPISAAGRDVVIVGGGDTGADCLGTAHRQGASSVLQLEILPEPPRERSPEDPWPTWPTILRISSAHEEGGERRYAVTATAFLGDEDGRVRGLVLQEVARRVVDGRVTFDPVPGSEREVPCQLVLLAMGFVGAERSGVVGELGLVLDPRGTVAIGPDWQTSRPGVFACGDMARGQSLIVWAIAEGRSCAAAVDRALMGETALPAPLVPGQLALR
ncbi:glutamate synthase subunit beta [Aciditerrimonas ferrireducens]|uniref:glutamate synthase subunit beta n=1 Tax=Aciditerrimonas ferrireducens TaxID=667306 RepID=UPI002004F9EE|nr:glutamate synthase subunit beta [Aciditerrimonas ferrireducens]MCK4177862.1 glutamate synthase subunit beta [Aciditerrimonas ferrireducens]